MTHRLASARGVKKFIVPRERRRVNQLSTALGFVVFVTREVRIRKTFDECINLLHD